MGFVVACLYCIIGMRQSYRLLLPSGVTMFFLRAQALRNDLIPVAAAFFQLSIEVLQFCSSILLLLT